MGGGGRECMKWLNEGLWRFEKGLDWSERRRNGHAKCSWMVGLVG